MPSRRTSASTSPRSVQAAASRTMRCFSAAEIGREDGKTGWRAGFPERLALAGVVDAGRGRHRGGSVLGGGGEGKRCAAHGRASG